MTCLCWICNSKCTSTNKILPVTIHSVGDRVHAPKNWTTFLCLTFLLTVKKIRHKLTLKKWSMQLLICIHIIIRIKLAHPPHNINFLRKFSKHLCVYTLRPKKFDSNFLTAISAFMPALPSKKHIAVTSKQKLTAL